MGRRLGWCDCVVWREGQWAGGWVGVTVCCEERDSGQEACSRLPRLYQQLLTLTAFYQQFLNARLCQQLLTSTTFIISC